jgi:hypothetical protein
MIEKEEEELILYLRKIRDISWQFNRQHSEFGTIESFAERALLLLGIKDGPPYPNPRPYGWWEGVIKNDPTRSQ